MNIACGAFENIEPVKAPVWNTSSASAATMVPSFFTPILMRDLVPDTGPVARKTSLRVSVILTGRRALRESRYDLVIDAQGLLKSALVAAVNPPNPDPMMTILCRSEGVAPGWLISCSSKDFTFDTASTVVARIPFGPRNRVRFAT